MECIFVLDEGADCRDRLPSPSDCLDRLPSPTEPPASVRRSLSARQDFVESVKRASKEAPKRLISTPSGSNSTTMTSNSLHNPSREMTQTNVSNGPPQREIKQRGRSTHGLAEHPTRSTQQQPRLRMSAGEFDLGYDSENAVESPVATTAYASPSGFGSARSFGSDIQSPRSPSLPARAELLWSGTGFDFGDSEVLRRRCRDLETERFVLYERMVALEVAEEAGRVRASNLEESCAELVCKCARLSMQVASMADHSEMERISHAGDTSSTQGEVSIADHENLRILTCTDDIERDSARIDVMTIRSKMVQELEEERQRYTAELAAAQSDLAAAVASQGSTENAQQLIRAELQEAARAQENAREYIRKELAAVAAEQERLQRELRLDIERKLFEELKEERSRHAAEVERVQAQLSVALALQINNEDLFEYSASDIDDDVAVDSPFQWQAESSSMASCTVQRRQARTKPRRPFFPRNPRLRSRIASKNARLANPRPKLQLEEEVEQLTPTRDSQNTQLKYSIDVECPSELSDSVDQGDGLHGISTSSGSTVFRHIKETDDHLDNLSTNAPSCVHDSLENSDVDDSQKVAEDRREMVPVQCTEATSRVARQKATNGKCRAESRLDDMVEVEIPDGVADCEIHDGVADFEDGLIDLYKDGLLRLDENCPCESGKLFQSCHYLCLGLDQVDAVKLDDDAHETHKGDKSNSQNLAHQTCTGTTNEWLRPADAKDCQPLSSRLSSNPVCKHSGTSSVPVPSFANPVALSPRVLVPTHFLNAALPTGCQTPSYFPCRQVVGASSASPVVYQYMQPPTPQSGQLGFAASTITSSVHRPPEVRATLAVVAPSPPPSSRGIGNPLLTPAKAQSPALTTRGIGTPLPVPGGAQERVQPRR